MLCKTIRNIAFFKHVYLLPHNFNPNQMHDSLYTIQVITAISIHAISICSLYTSSNKCQKIEVDKKKSLHSMFAKGRALAHTLTNITHRACMCVWIVPQTKAISVTTSSNKLKTQINLNSKREFAKSSNKFGQIFFWLNFPQSKQMAFP